jgi:hypothetical protein
VSHLCHYGISLWELAANNIFLLAATAMSKLASPTTCHSGWNRPLLTMLMRAGVSRLGGLATEIWDLA